MSSQASKALRILLFLRSAVGNSCVYYDAFQSKVLLLRDIGQDGGSTEDVTEHCAPQGVCCWLEGCALASHCNFWTDQQFVRLAGAGYLPDQVQFETLEDLKAFMMQRASEYAQSTAGAPAQ